MHVEDPLAPPSDAWQSKCMYSFLSGPSLSFIESQLFNHPLPHSHMFSMVLRKTSRGASYTALMWDPREARLFLRNSEFPCLPKVTQSFEALSFVNNNNVCFRYSTYKLVLLAHRHIPPPTAVQGEGRSRVRIPLCARPLLLPSVIRDCRVH